MRSRVVQVTRNVALLPPLRRSGRSLEMRQHVSCGVDANRHQVSTETASAKSEAGNLNHAEASRRAVRSADREASNAVLSPKSRSHCVGGSGLYFRG